MKKGAFDLEDLAEQLRQLQKLGGMSGMMGMLPGMGKIKKQLDGADLDNGVLKRQMAIISSMTPYEKRNPKVMNASRKKRVAAGSGTKVEEINRLLKMHLQMADMMKQMGQRQGHVRQDVRRQGRARCGRARKDAGRTGNDGSQCDLPPELHDMMAGGALPEMPKPPPALPGLGGASGLAACPALAACRASAAAIPRFPGIAGKEAMTCRSNSKPSDCASGNGAKMMSIRSLTSIAIRNRRRSMAAACHARDVWRRVATHHRPFPASRLRPLALEDKATREFAAMPACGFPMAGTMSRSAMASRRNSAAWASPTEAARRVRDHGFRELGLARLVSYINPINATSIRVAEKLGAAPDGEFIMHGKPHMIYRHIST